LKNGLEKRRFLVLRFCGSRRNGSSLKRLAESLHADGVGYMLSAGWEVKMEIADKARDTRLDRVFSVRV